MAYQSCDDSTAQTGGTNPFLCARNAKAYARHLKVVGVIGAYNSGCSEVEIQINATQTAIGDDQSLNALASSHACIRACAARSRRPCCPTGKRNCIPDGEADRLSCP